MSDTNAATITSNSNETATTDKPSTNPFDKKFGVEMSAPETKKESTNRFDKKFAEHNPKPYVPKTFKKHGHGNSLIRCCKDLECSEDVNWFEFCCCLCCCFIPMIILLVLSSYELDDELKYAITATKETCYVALTHSYSCKYFCNCPYTDCEHIICDEANECEHIPCTNCSKSVCGWGEYHCGNNCCKAIDLLNEQCCQLCDGYYYSYSVYTEKCGMNVAISQKESEIWQKDDLCPERNARIIGDSFTCYVSECATPQNVYTEYHPTEQNSFYGWIVAVVGSAICTVCCCINLYGIMTGKVNYRVFE